jgi:hypothetical protein
MHRGLICRICSYSNGKYLSLLRVGIFQPDDGSRGGYPSASSACMMTNAWFRVFRSILQAPLQGGTCVIKFSLQAAK